MPARPGTAMETSHSELEPPLWDVPAACEAFRKLAAHPQATLQGFLRFRHEVASAEWSGAAAPCEIEL